MAGLLTTPLTPTPPKPATTQAPAAVATTPAPQSAQFTPVTRTLDAANETTQGQMGALLAKDSPYLTAARARASAAMNQRGLLNSTLAGTAGEAAAIDAALPIAQADAGAYQVQAGKNQDAQNVAGQTNAAAENQFKLSDKGFQQQKDINTQQFLHTQGLNTQQFNYQAGLNQQQFQHQTDLNTQQEQAQTRLATLDQSFKTALAKLNQDQAKELQALTAGYSATLQRDRNAAEMYMMAMQAIGQGYSNGNLNAAQQQALAASTISTLGAGLNFVAAASGNGQAPAAAPGVPTLAAMVPSAAPATTAAPTTGTPTTYTAPTSTIDLFRRGGLLSNTGGN